MYRKSLHAMLAILLFSATQAEASVLINEIAWMGTSESSADEWIELVNTGSSDVDLSGWNLRALDGSPAIALSGVISAQGYYLIERTDDTTVPSISADLVASFGNGLSNGGETLQLLNDGDQVTNTVDSGESWSLLGGDNETKQTAQLTSSGWITANGTPRSENQTSSGEVLGANTTSNATSTAQSTTLGSGSGVSKPSLYPRTNIVVEATQDLRGFTGFPIVFVGSSTGLYNEPLDRATYRYNFGDGATGEGKVAEHVYTIPGEYIVTIEVFWANYHASDRLTVTIIEPDIVIERVTPGALGYVLLANKTTREIDLSSWSLRDSAGATFIFPPNSTILGGKTFTLPSAISGFSSSTRFTLFHPDLSLADTFPDKEPVTVPPTASSQKNNTKNASVSSSKVATTEKGGVAANTEAEATTSAESIVLFERDTAPGTLSALASVAGAYKTPLLAVTATFLVVFAGMIIYRNRHGEDSIEKEYTIIEDIIEGEEKLQ